MNNTMPKTSADAIMDFATFLYVQAELDVGNVPSLDSALNFAREEFKQYCKINDIKYIDEDC